MIADKVNVNYLYKKTINRYLYNYGNIHYGFPHNITFDFEQCNLKCKMCSRRKADLVKTKYPLEIVQKVTKEVGEAVKKSFYKYFYFYFAGLGEPLINDDIPEMLSLLKEGCPSAGINFFSNFTIYSEEVYKAILKNCDLINVSLNAPNRKEYIEVNGVDSFDKVVNNLKKLIKLNKDHKYNNRIHVQIYKTPGNEKAIEEFILKSNKIGIKNEELYIKSHLHNWGGYLGNKFDNGNGIQKYRNPCIYPWHNLYIDPLGNVYPCLVGCFRKRESKLFLGNIYDKSIKDIYKNTKIKVLRKEHRMCEWGNTFPECIKCDLYTNTDNKYFFFYNYLHFNRLWKWI